MIKCKERFTLCWYLTCLEIKADVQKIWKCRQRATAIIPPRSYRKSNWRNSSDDVVCMTFSLGSYFSFPPTEKRRRREEEESKNFTFVLSPLRLMGLCLKTLTPRARTLRPLAKKSKRLKRRREKEGRRKQHISLLCSGEKEKKVELLRDLFLLFDRRPRTKTLADELRKQVHCFQLLLTCCYAWKSESTHSPISCCAISN